MNLTGEAVWKTASQPWIACSKEHSSKRSALNTFSLSFAPSSARRCSVFAVSANGKI